MLENADTISQITYNDYVGLIDSMMEQIVVRRRSKKHPQLFIWGPLEARLQRADIVILGGLNEGTWPPTAPEDPWMSRPMRETFGLPPNDKRIGLSAHDFVQSASAEHLLLTRSNRTNDGPEIASRWLLRLKTQLTKVGLESGPYNRGKEWRALYKQINSTNVVASPIQMPAPCPPINSRPRKLSVTQIERWMGDPYSIYARHILRLKPMQPLEATNDASVRGNIIHEILHTFMKNTGPKLPSDALERLISLGNDVFLDNEIRPGDLAYWWPRFERIAQWFINTENSRLKTAEFLGGEVYGSLELFAPGGNFVLTAKADRIDLLSDGSLSIIDYKTGVMPNGMQVRSGKAPQLPLEGAIAAAGGFKKIRAHDLSQLAYWHLSGGNPPGKIHPTKESTSQLITEALSGLKELINIFDDSKTPYLCVPRPSWAPKWNDYTHLARINEWGIQDLDDPNSE